MLTALETERSMLMPLLALVATDQHLEAQVPALTSLPVSALISVTS
jgi:hypothetical protein